MIIPFSVWLKLDILLDWHCGHLLQLIYSSLLWFEETISAHAIAPLISQSSRMIELLILHNYFLDIKFI